MSNMALDVIVRLRDLLSNRLRGLVGRFRSAFATIARLARLAATALAAAFTAAFSVATTEAAKFQDLWSDANKTLGLNDFQLDRFKDGLDEIASRIPLLRAELVAMTGEAGRLGIRGEEELLKFVELSAVMATAFDIIPTEAAQIMGEIREQLGYSIDQLSLLGDKINWLGNNTKASEAQISRFYSRVAGIASEAGLAEDAVLALGGAMIAAGRAPEVAATSMRALLRELGGGALTASGRQLDAFGSLGIDPDEIARTLKTDGVAAIREVVAAISSLPEWERSGVAGVLFGEEALRGFGALLTNIKALDASLGRIDEFGGDAVKGAMEEEFLGATDDVLDNWQKFKNVMSDIRDGMGEPFLAPINNGLKTMIGYLRSLDERATVFDRLGAGARGFLAGLGLDVDTSALAARLKPLRDFLFGDPDQDAGDVLGRTFESARDIGDVVGRAADGLRDLFQGGAPALERFWQSLEPYLGPAAERLGPIFDSMARGFEALGSLVGDVVSSSGMELFAGILGHVLGMIANVGLGTLQAFAVAFEAVATVLAFLADLAFDDRNAIDLSPMLDAAVDMAQAFNDAVMTEIDELVDWFSGLPGRILSAIGSIDIGSLISWPELPGWLSNWGGGEGPDEPEGTDTVAGRQGELPVPPPQDVNVGGAVHIRVDGPAAVVGTQTDNPAVPVVADRGATTGSP